MTIWRPLWQIAVALSKAIHRAFVLCRGSHCGEREDGKRIDLPKGMPGCPNDSSRNTGGERGQDATIKLIWPLEYVLFNIIHGICESNDSQHLLSTYSGYFRENRNTWKDHLYFHPLSRVSAMKHKIKSWHTAVNLDDCWALALLVYVWVVCYFRCLLRSFQIPILCPGSVWQGTLLCRLWCQAAGPPKSSRSQARNREKRPLCDWISFWAPRCLINENDPGAESEAIVYTVTKSLPINSIFNRISQSTPGVLNLLA